MYAKQLSEEDAFAGRQYTLEQLQDACRTAVGHWVDKAEKSLAEVGKQLPMPEVSFDLRGLSAGMAVISRKSTVNCRIRINTYLLQHYPREMMEQTVPHEVAHLVTYALHGKLDHGPEWRAVMDSFGVPAERCHQMQAVPARRHRKHKYHCGCREHMVGPGINRRIRRGYTYQCRYCSRALQPAA